LFVKTERSVCGTEGSGSVRIGAALVVLLVGLGACAGEEEVAPDIAQIRAKKQVLEDLREEIRIGFTALRVFPEEVKLPEAAFARALKFVKDAEKQLRACESALQKGKDQVAARLWERTLEMERQARLNLEVE
jgi:hypothetical protein